MSEEVRINKTSSIISSISNAYQTIQNLWRSTQEIGYPRKHKSKSKNTNKSQPKDIIILNHNLKYYHQLRVNANNDYLNLLYGYCRNIEIQNKLSSVIPNEIVIIISKYCLFEKFDVEITNERLRESIFINKHQTIIRSLPENGMSTIYGNIVVGTSESHSWTIKRNKFDPSNNNFFVGVIKNDIIWLYDNINGCNWDYNGNGYFIDCISLLGQYKQRHAYNHSVDLRIQITVDMNERSVQFYGLINRKIVGEYKFTHINMNEYRLAVALFGAGTELELC